MYKKGKRQVSSPKTNSIFTNSWVSAALGRVTKKSILAPAPDVAPPFDSCRCLPGAQQQPGSKSCPESYLKPRAVRAQAAGRCSPVGGKKSKEESFANWQMIYGWGARRDLSLISWPQIFLLSRLCVLPATHFYSKKTRFWGLFLCAHAHPASCAQDSLLALCSCVTLLGHEVAEINAGQPCVNNCLIHTISLVSSQDIFNFSNKSLIQVYLILMELK